MAIPKFDEIRVAAIHLLAGGQTMKMLDFLEPLTRHFNLTDEEVNAMYPSGNGHVFYDRVSWALSYLNMAGLLEKPGRGLYRISPLGTEMLKTPDKINSFVDSEMAERERQKKRHKTTEAILIQNVDDATPQEILYASFSEIRSTVYEEILTTILGKTPAAFEKLVVMLLQKMGYGGEIKNSGIVTKKSSDGGIDGIIKEDILGFGRINIQAKRYRLDLAIDRPEIQKFVGALAVAQSSKGVFITTSYFTKGAVEYVDNLYGNTTVVLIDGKSLARYIYDYGLGMQIEETIEIKKMDADFWDSMSNE